MRDESEWMRRVNRIIDAASEIRQQDPGIGCLKLWLMMKGMFSEGWVPGRDQFFNLMRIFGITLRRPKPRHTTNSNHRYHKYKNLIKNFIPTATNQLWVSDITYIDTGEGCCYLHLVTDAYSHKIIGWCLSETLHAAYTLKALRMAIESAEQESLNGLIHHSDRGVQYCCNDYVFELNKYQISISMCEDYNPTDNAIAERVNGILKSEVIYRRKQFKDYDEALSCLTSFIQFYNEKRPHSSIGYKVPSVAHLETGAQVQKWRKAEEKRSRGLSAP